jgi:hypothetical protein
LDNLVEEETWTAVGASADMRYFDVILGITYTAANGDTLSAITTDRIGYSDQGLVKGSA